MDKITIQVTVNASVDKIWTYWTTASHIKEWYHASEDWWVPSVEQNFAVGDSFCYRMAAKDESMAFDFDGKFTEIIDQQSITYVLEDGREVVTTFEQKDGAILLVQVFDVEDSVAAEMQKQGWQAILETFKAYVES